MFYVAGTKIYLATFDDEMKVYPECILVQGIDGAVTIARKGGGVARRPKHYELCTLVEVIAQLGANAEPAMGELVE